MGATAVRSETGGRALRWREVLDAAARISGRIFRGLWGSRVLVTLLMLLVLTVSALAVVYASHLNRTLYGTLTDLRDERDAYQRQWTQLLLEQSALSAHSHVEGRAARELEMKVPARDDIVVVTTR
ncbi:MULTISPECIES: cell division protein FtsL [Gammaproteobacteria]|uniref:Cell division protein FtsL n=1 Tax=Vreelandella halophila TaxID=86177 RepID=A0A9X5B4T3_9GAMM|nr:MULTISPECIES: cell division protein FtsL [Gammaproteobacteria]KAA8980676.1 cell division protein FtsL [Halospina sp. K52047b]MYL26665.1 cell division protein FtsL [Halomonas utahensis]MYL74002.1 cell division protein FtsL [Halomonas sp. 22501_18_FS]